ADWFVFLQEEDGIRGFHVTGVQTCALPILRAPTLLTRMSRRPCSASTCAKARAVASSSLTSNARAEAARPWPRNCSTAARTAPALRPLISTWAPLPRSEEHTSELQSRENLVCRLL